MRTTWLRWVLAASALVGSVSAEARTVRDEPYSVENTWNAAIRMVRVDFGFTIDERDRELGYFTFQYREGRRSVPGSVEILRAEVDGRPSSRVIVQIQQMPGYVESMMLQRLARKLRSEYGEVVVAPHRPSAPQDPPRDGAPVPPGTQPTQPPGAAPPPPQGAPAPTTAPLTSGRWEAPPRMRAFDDFSE